MNLDDYIGSVVISAGSYAGQSESRVFCIGQLLKVADYTSYFSLVQATYGGDGRNTVGVPDLRTRSPVGAGQLPGGEYYRLGQLGGAQRRSVTLTERNVPFHSHAAEFKTGQLNTAITTRAGATDVPISATLRCDSGSGGSNDPSNRYPGTALDASVQTWASRSDAGMASDALVNAAPIALNARTMFPQTTVDVTVDSAGAGRPYEVDTALPLSGAFFYIVVQGIYPLREDTSSESEPNPQ